MANIHKVEQHKKTHASQSNVSHVVLAANYRPSPVILNAGMTGLPIQSKADGASVLTFMGPSGPILMAEYSVGTTTKDQLSTFFTANKAAESANPEEQNYLQNKDYNQGASATLDSIFIPISAGFKIRTLSGEIFNSEGGKDKETDLRFPSFETPFAYVNNADATKSFSSFMVQGSGLPSSAVLNPYVIGSTIEMSLAGNDPKEIATQKTKNQSPSLPKFGSTTIKADSPARPVAFRGPMVMSGWGFDLEGLPVPNAKLESDLRVGDPHSSRYGKTIMFSQKFPGAASCDPAGTGFDVSTWSSTVDSEYTDADGSKVYVLSDGSTVTYTLKDKGTSSEVCIAEQTFPNKIPNTTKQHFLNGHLRRTDKWKTGPIDLRWDRERKVWVGGRHNGVYLSKATKCILPKAGPDGKNSFNLGVGGNINNPGRLYRNVCPNEPCEFSVYFARSPHYPDIEIYDPEDIDWGGNCQVKEDANGNPYVNCTDFRNNCVPFYDAVILRSVDHYVAGGDYSDCGDKFRKTSNGSPYARRMGDPCHGMGGAYSDQKMDSKVEQLSHKVEAGRFSDAAMSTLYQKIFIENPLGQGLNLGDNFFSYDTGRRVIFEYVKSDMQGSHIRNGFPAGNPVTVKEIIPVHVILQGEFFGMDIITHAGCEQGEMAACTRKFFAQGYVTPEDCGPNDDYPTRGII